MVPFLKVLLIKSGDHEEKAYPQVPSRFSSTFPSYVHQSEIPSSFDSVQLSVSMFV